MFGIKKKEKKEQEPAPKTERVDMVGIEKNKTQEAPKMPALREIMSGEFAREWQGSFNALDVEDLNEDGKLAMQMDMLFAIYGELRLIRDKLNAP